MTNEDKDTTTTTKNNPSIDCISRQAVLNKILKFSVTEGRSVSVKNLQTEINELPPVIPQEARQGHWIRVTDKAGHLVWECDNCNWQQRFNTNFCPDCGYHMV